VDDNGNIVIAFCGGFVLYLESVLNIQGLLPVN